MNKIKYVITDDTAKVQKLQDAAIRSANKVRVQVQIALVATAAHIAKHGDYTMAQRIVDGLGNTVNGRAVVEWLVKYAGVTVAADGKGFGGLVKGFTDYIRQRFNTEDAKKVGMEVGAKDCMWWELKQQNVFKGFSLEQALQQVIKRHTAAVEQAGDHAELVQTEVSENTIRQVMQLAHFEKLLGDAMSGGNPDAEVAADPVIPAEV